MNRKDERRREWERERDDELWRWKRRRNKKQKWNYAILWISEWMAYHSYRSTFPIHRNIFRGTCYTIIRELWIFLWIDASKIYTIDDDLHWQRRSMLPFAHCALIHWKYRASHKKRKKARNPEFLLWHSSWNQFCFLDLN